GSSSFAKKADADFRISLALRSSLFSRRSSFSSSRSELASRSARFPESASAWRTHWRRDSYFTPRSAATWAIGRPDSNTSRTARCFNSSGYFLGLGIFGGSPLRRTDHPAFEVSVKPGLAHFDAYGHVHVDVWRRDHARPAGCIHRRRFVGVPVQEVLRRESRFVRSMPAS